MVHNEDMTTTSDQPTWEDNIDPDVRAYYDMVAAKRKASKRRSKPLAAYYAPIIHITFEDEGAK